MTDYKFSDDLNATRDDSSKNAVNEGLRKIKCALIGMDKHNGQSNIMNLMIFVK